MGSLLVGLLGNLMVGVLEQYLVGLHELRFAVHVMLQDSLVRVLYS